MKIIQEVQFQDIESHLNKTRNILERRKDYWDERAVTMHQKGKAEKETEALKKRDQFYKALDSLNECQRSMVDLYFGHLQKN